MNTNVAPSDSRANTPPLFILQMDRRKLDDFGRKKTIYLSALVLAGGRFHGARTSPVDSFFGFVCRRRGCRDTFRVISGAARSVVRRSLLRGGFVRGAKGQPKVTADADGGLMITPPRTCTLPPIHTLLCSWAEQT
ncbi:hypothetical protein DPEC_G00276170 [Dallia pectoralis]|uniref:Uncharacterized protein n=1 Tax=Dallia pectoralis TaxID=75939 RepID=A0ACC2FLF0_DALPE|nr:hypothetical protein DPEC_G00276170 [Dallia pectoralis]